MECASDPGDHRDVLLADEDAEGEFLSKPIYWFGASIKTRGGKREGGTLRIRLELTFSFLVSPSQKFFSEKRLR